MTSIFKDFDKGTQKAAITRYVNTPTVELLYQTDKKAVDAFLDGDSKSIKDKAAEIEQKPEEERDGTEQLYLRVASLLPDAPAEVNGSEGLFSTVWSLIKRFLSMIGNFFKWLAETFFGFGTRSKTDFNKLEAKVKAGEINYDTELKYPSNAKSLIDSKRFKSFPANLDWLGKELDNLVNRTDGTIKTFTAAKDLFAKVQDKKVAVSDVERFGAAVATHLGGKLGSGEFRIVGALWAVVAKDKDNAITFTLNPVKQTEVTGESKFMVSEGKFDGLVDKLEKTSNNLVRLAEISKNEGSLFNVKIKEEKDLQGIGKAEAYAMAAAFRSLVNFIAFIKHVMTAIQQADTAAHDIMGKAFK
jgi:hypothetical protein